MIDKSIQKIKRHSNPYQRHLLFKTGSPSSLKGALIKTFVEDSSAIR